MYVWLRQGVRALSRLVARVVSGVLQVVDELALMPVNERETFAQMITRRATSMCLTALALVVLAVPSLHPQVASHSAEALFRLSSTLWNPPGAA